MSGWAKEGVEEMYIMYNKFRSVIPTGSLVLG